MAEAIRVEGLRDLERALRRADKESAKELRRELREAGKVVSAEARSRFASVDARSAMGIRPRVRAGATVTVEQSRRRTTGQRPDFGALQMRRALLPALAAKEDEVFDRVEAALDRVARKEGF